MDVPGIGQVSHAQLRDPELCFDILSGCKHQLLEGLIVENLVDQWLRALPPDSGVEEVRQSTLLCQRWQNGREKSPVAFVLVDQGIAYPSSYIQALAGRMSVIPVSYDADSCEFLTVSGWREGTNPSPALTEPLLAQLQLWLGQYPDHVSVAHHVRDQNRQKGSFWGFLRTTYGDGLVDQVVIPRLFKDYGPQLFFRGGWDVDRIVSLNSELWSLEVKHKFPFGRETMQFGINTGELKSIRWLHEAGIRSLHLVVVKPVWDKAEPPHYILNEFDKRSRAVVLGLVLDGSAIDQISSGNIGQSNADTTFSGRGALKYHSILASSFSKLGLVSDPPEKIAGAVLSMMRGEALPRVTDEELSRCRVVRERIHL